MSRRLLLMAVLPLLARAGHAPATENSGMARAWPPAIMGGFAVLGAPHRRRVTACAARTAGVIAVMCVPGCTPDLQFQDRYELARATTGGNPHKGRQVILNHGCGSCHIIPGITGATGLVGPPLMRMGVRTYIAGVLPNTPENMVRWIKNPPAVDRLTAMPNLELKDADARDAAAYLYTLR